MTALRAALHRAFHEPEARSYRLLAALVGMLILISVAILVSDALRGPGLPRPRWLDELDHAILLTFGLEIGLRILSYHPPALDFYHLSPSARLRSHLLGRLRFALQPLNLIDIATVATVLPALRGLRALRLLRLLRLRRFLRYSDPLAGLAQAFRDNSLLYLFGLSLLIGGAGMAGLSIWLVESRRNPGIERLTDGLWWALVTLTTVGFGDIVPQTGQGRLIGALTMVAGMFLLALFAGIVGNTLLSTVLSVRREQFIMSQYLDHVVVCGYEAGSRMLLDVITSELDLRRRAVVLFAPGERPKDVPPEIIWVDGDPTKESELAKARVAHAAQIVVIGPRSQLPQVADATTILTVFTLRRYLRGLEASGKLRRQRPLYVVAEILDEENVEHARKAGADEVIETTYLGFSLVAHALTMPGTARLVSSLATQGGQSVYLGRLPAGIEAPTDFRTLSQLLRDSTGALLLGLEDPRSGERQLNPPPETPVTAGTALIYLAHEAVLAAI